MICSLHGIEKKQKFSNGKPNGWWCKECYRIQELNYHRKKGRPERGSSEHLIKISGENNHGWSGGRVAYFQRQYEYIRSRKESDPLYRAKWNEYSSRRRARKASAAGSNYTTAELIQARFDYYGNRCRYCGSEGELTIDHMIPLSRNGTHWPSNLAPACKSCNSIKNARTFKEFLSEV